MIHPDTELRFINDQIGYGVVATKFIPKGTITWVLDRFDREFSQTEIDSMESTFKEIVDKYCFRNNKGLHTLCWDNARYVNHSFNSNCLSTAYDFEIAIRDIHVGQELTDDYGYLNISMPFRALDEGTRRKIVYPDDLLKYHKTWDSKLLSAIKHFPKVEQPLKSLVGDDLLHKLDNICRGLEPMDSILNCYYNSEVDFQNNHVAR